MIGATPTAPVVSQQISSQTWVVGAAIDFALPANTFTDPQHENLTYSATLVGGGQLPSWLGFNGITGTFIGTVPNGTSGLNISVTATDTSGLSASETFSVVTPASAPVVSQQTSNQTWGVGTAIYFTLPANTFTDPQHENLTYSATLVGEGQLPSWLGFNGITGTFTGTVPNGTSGLNISVTATDTSGLSASETFSVVTPASAPVVSQQTSNQTWGVGTAIYFTLPANTFTDPQHENLTYSATLVGEGQLPSWLGFNGITGTFTGTVPNGTSGLNISVTATDTSGLSASETFSVMTPASAPVVSQQTSNQTWGVGTAIDFTLPANTFTDPQHENLTYSATLVGEGQLPSWLGFNGITGTFTGTVPNGTSGLNISVTATDTSGLSASETFSVVIPASAPVVSQQTSNQTWGVGTAIDFTLPANTFTDPQHENLTYSATLVGGGQLPSWLGFNGITGTFTGTVPNGTSGLNISVTATDTSGLSASETFSVATPASTPVGISPMRASGFLSTLGVDTHIPYTDGGYVNLGNVVADLHYLGITQVRDSLSDGSNGSAPLSSDIYLAQQGIKFTTIVETSTTAGLNYALSLIDQVNEAVPGSITAVEGPNEINNFPLTFNGVSGLQGAIDLQKALYADVHSDPNLAGVPVDYFTGYDAGSIGTGPNPYTTAGLADYDTQHPYPTYGQAPAWFVSPSNSLPNEGPVYGPAVYTETGYSTNGGSSGGLVAVNQDVQAKYTLDLLMDAAKDGISKTYLYQLMDAYQPGSPQGDDGFGLFDPNNAPKEAATAIHNLTTILADNGAGSSTFTTTPLNYSVAGLPSTGNNMLMEKSNGAYDIVVWNEPQIWNESTGTEITAPTVNVNVQLGKTYSDVEVFDPLVGSTPIQTLTHVSSVQLGITDHPLIVEIEPAPIVTAQSAGASGAATIGAGATLELTAADSATVTFKASTGMLKLDNPSTFTGEIFNFTGNGSLSGSDQIDLRTINYNSVHDSYSTGVLTVTDGTNIANLHFSGSYTLANFKFASDGSGGTIVYDPPVLNSPTAGTRIVTADRSNDAFLFHTNLSQTASTEHTFGTDTVHVDQAEFAWASLAIVHDAHENVIFPDALHDTHNNALAQQHHSGFLI